MFRALITSVFVASVLTVQNPVVEQKVEAKKEKEAPVAVLAQAQRKPGNHVVEAKIVGPAKAEIGDLVVLDATSSEGAEQFAWVLANSNKTFLPVEGGSKVVFASGTAGDYKFVLVAAGNANNKLDISVAQWTVVIGQPTPTPVPTPVPPVPVPNPNPPPILTGFAKIAYNNTPPSGKQCAPALANNFESTAAKLAAGGYADVSAANAELKTKNQAVINTPDLLNAWLPFFKAWAAQADVSLRSKEDYVAAFNDTAKGFRAVDQ